MFYSMHCNILTQYIILLIKYFNTWMPIYKEISLHKGEIFLYHKNITTVFFMSVSSSVHL